MAATIVKGITLNDLERGINNFNINLTDLPGGNYFLQVQNSQGTFARVKISIMKL